MTDRREEDDQIVAAVVDREATAAEEARVAADPTLRARAAEFRAVADAVASASADVEEGARDRAVHAALAASAPANGAEGPGRAPRSWTATLPRPVLAAAAAVTVLALGATVVTQLDSGGGDDGVESAESAAPDLAPEPLDLGAVDSSAQIRDRVVEATGLVSTAPAAEAAGGEADAAAGSAAGPEAFRADESGGTDDGGAAEPGERLSETCEIAAVEANPDLLGLIAEGEAVYQGIDALVYVYNAAVGADAVVLVVATDDCRGLDRFVL